MYVSILKNSEFDRQLQQNGYAIVPYLTASEVENLTQFFYKEHATLPEGMYASSHAPDFALRQRMNEKIKEVCSRALTNTFTNVSALGGTFMAKSKGQYGALHAHQDWNIVDERQYNSYNVWIPLVDVTKENGTIEILPHSHTLLHNIRGLNIPSSYDDVKEQVYQHLKPLNMKAGEALVYDHRLLHASGINQTNQPRLVIVYGVIPAQAEMRYYYGNGNNIEVYNCSPDFFFTQNINSGPVGLALIETIPNNNPVVTTEILNKKYAPQLSWWQKIKSLAGVN